MPEHVPADPTSLCSKKEILLIRDDLMAPIERLCQRMAPDYPNADLVRVLLRTAAVLSNPTRHSAEAVAEARGLYLKYFPAPDQGAAVRK